MDMSHKEPLSRDASIRTQAILIFLCGISLLVAELRTGDQSGRLPPALDRLDPNRAAWFELSQLPGVGRALAERIVDFRERRRAADSTTRVFRSIGDLRQVRGIGQKTAARLERYLQFGDGPVR